MYSNKFKIPYLRYCLALGVLIYLSGCSTKITPSKGTDDAFLLNHKVDSVLALMTLQEKAGQLSIFGANKNNLEELIKEGLVGGTNGMIPNKKDVSGHLRKLQQLAMQSRLKIPLLFMGDVIHGYRTTFPVPLAMSCTWDTSLVRKADSVAAFEATADGMNWSFAPMVDLSHDPRWGRVMEGAGEDPFLAAAMAAAEVKGLQGNDLANPHTMAATAKHFAAYGAVEAGRDYNTVNISERELWDLYLPPFEAAIHAGVAAIMPAFIALNGIPASENGHLLKTILRKKLKFKGLVVSDYDAIPELLNHRVVSTPAEAAADAIKAGMDMDLHSGTYLDVLPELVRDGIVKETTIDSAVRNVLALKFKLGLFDHPFQYGENGSDHLQDSLLAQHRNIAREAALRSIVLLKNDHDADSPDSNQYILPLSKHIRTLAVIGPLAKDQKEILGPVHALGRPGEAISVWQGIKEAISPGTKLLYAEGTDIAGDSAAGFPEAVAAAQQADAVVMVLGESAGMSGEGDSRSALGLPGNQLDLVKAVLATGKPLVVVLMNGRPLTIPWLDENVPAILETWFPGTEGGHAVADILFGDYNPSAKLTMTFPRNTGQIPIYYNHLNTGRPFEPGNKYTSRYVDIPNSPLYPFGYGLSYTRFSYSVPHLSTDSLGWNDTLKVSVDITNKGPRSGKEIVQLYLSDLVASVSPPVKELKGFKSVILNPGETRAVSFYLTREDLAFYNKDMDYTAEPGAFELYIGESSDTKNKVSFWLLDR